MTQTKKADDEATLQMCSECTLVEACMERWDTPQFIEQQQRCRLATQPPICSKCGARRDTTESPTVNGLSWARRHGKQYCPKCYQTLPPLTQPANKDEQKDESRSPQREREEADAKTKRTKRTKKKRQR